MYVPSEESKLLSYIVADPDLYRRGANHELGLSMLCLGISFVVSLYV